MKVLAIDIEKHFPPISKIFENTDYYSPNIPETQLKDLQPIPRDEECNEIYNFYPMTELDQLNDEYDLCLIVWPINSFDDPWYTPNIVERQTFFKEIFKLLSSKNIKKVAWFDDSDRALCARGVKWLNKEGIPCDAVFKRDYRRTHLWEYAECVHPFPFMTFGKPNPPWLLYENRVKGNSGLNACFWSGAPIDRFEPGVPDEWCNRLGMLKQIYPYLIMKSGLPKEEFLNQFNTYKFFLHLNGTGHICGRFFEGLSRDSLMLMQEMDTVFPFANEKFFHEMTIFVRPEEFVQKLGELQINRDLYAECKQTQEEILEKYYNYEYMREYILSCLE